ncbi:MAG: hypothetical protein RR478_04125 [Bacilli bacterium]
MFFSDLTDDLIPLMLEEVDLDINEGTLYLSPRLTEYGLFQYPLLLKKSIINLSFQEFLMTLQAPEILKTTEVRKNKSGGYSNVKVPSNAASLIAEGEFNKFYIRALCKKAISENLTLKVYRAKPVTTPRADSEAKIGLSVSAVELLDDLRSTKGIDSHLGLPNGYNSGLSIKIS